jgi:hypothetical protein
MAAGPAAAKGADQAVITGPGLAKPIVVDGNGEPGSGETLGVLADGGGLFIAMFGGPAGQRLAESPPPGDLGPRYQIAYRVPGGDKPDIVRQDLYPVAAGGPVTYTAAGQTVFGNPTTGGWYQGTPDFARALRALGILTPAASPTAAAATAAGRADGGSADGGGAPWPLIGGLAGAALIMAAAVMAVRAMTRRRSRAAM